MYPEQNFKNSTVIYRKQKGLGLPSALFLIVVMVMIVAAINQINEMNAATYGREWLSMRAFYAAESGAQTAGVYVINTSVTTPTCDNSFINGLTPAGMSVCTLNVTCSSQTVNSLNYFTLTSTATCGEGIDAATRVIQVRVQP